MPKSLAVIGLDGMSWRYFRKLLDKGVMPYTKGLLMRSFATTLVCLPPTTPPSWASIMTGVNPGKHGIFGFFFYERGSWTQRLYTVSELEHPRVHEMLSMRGLRSIVFNPIPDYPIPKVRNAEVISNLFFVPNPISQPEDAHRKYFGLTNPGEMIKSPSCEVLDECLRIVEVYLEAAGKALASDHSLLWINLNLPDVVLHRCPEMLRESRVLAGERRLFNLLDKLVKEVGEAHDSVVIVSDHGFARYSRIVSVNDILVKHGYARATEVRGMSEVGEYRIERRLAHVKGVRWVRVPPFVYKAVKLLRLRRLARGLLSLYGCLTRNKVVVSTSRWVDVNHSAAFLPDHYSFGVYLRDRRFLVEVHDLLKKYNELKTYLPEEFYHGPFVHRAPDIVLFPRFDLGYWVHGNNVTGLITASGDYYAHHPSGVLVVRDEELLNTELKPGSLPNYVVGWLVLHLLGQPLPKSRDRHEPLERALDVKAEENYLARWRVMTRLRKVMGR
ncbi:MAG: hypothetical protein DRJ41_01060 [Thermoprotei archaeon]|nr:MAG: hypothetical protein DRJ41_01060 [Thermoprotei archaeon]